MLGRRKTLGHIRSINPSMIIDKPRQSQSRQLVKIKMLNGPARNHRMALPAMPCVFLRRMGWIFLTFKGKLWKMEPNHEIWVPRGMISLRQAVGNDMKKKSLHLIFTFYLNRVTLVLEIYILLQTRSHIVTINQHNYLPRVFCPQLTRNVRTVAVLTVLLLLPIRVNWEKSLKVWCQ